MKLFVRFAVSVLETFQVFETWNVWRRINPKAYWAVIFPLASVCPSLPFMSKKYTPGRNPCD